MRLISTRNILLFVFSIVFIGVLTTNVSADDDCYQYGSQNSGTRELCNSAGCMWTSDDPFETVGIYPAGEIDMFDPWCTFDEHCCLPNQCWQYDGTNENNCTAAAGLNCTWDPYATFTLPNQTAVVGGCFTNWASDSDMVWGGMSEGCWQYDGDQATCTSAANAQTCSWSANGANQNPWCNIKTLSDAQMDNADATSLDIGCCDSKGCWDYDGNETLCNDNIAYEGLCSWMNTTDDPWCNDPLGCCMVKWCSEIIGEANCTQAKTDLYMPCVWDSSGDGLCTEEAGGGFISYNDTDSCMSQGGWWNSSNDCVMPNSDGGGGFMFVADAHCWFADNQVAVCGNITGCVYCDDSGSEINNASSACYNNPVGYCQGHEPSFSNWNGTDNVVVEDIAIDNLNCSHIQIKSACNYGPLPTCKWVNSSAITGEFCEPGISSEQKASPPVPFCEHPDAKNNYSLCTELIEKYMMPCTWDNTSTIVKNCTFNSQAVFGSSTTEKEFEVIASEVSCVASSGTWQSEFYIDSDGSLKQDAWCEKGAMYDFSTGQAAANKGNCNEDCWACEFNSTGEAYVSQSASETVCVNSVLGYCRWTNDTSAPNSYGYCDYPNEMSYGAGECNTNCPDCGLMSNPYESCIGSPASCKWVNDTDTTTGVKLIVGVCVSQSKKVCDSDCFSCYDFMSCNSSSINCQWTDSICQPATSESYEICFDGSDNDGDGMIDCNDPDCGFDSACGGSSFADCMQYINDATCNVSIAFGDQNCTWITFPWETEGHCDMPGSNCWMYDGNMTACGLQPGCNNDSTGEFSNSFCDVNMSRIDTVQCWQYSDNDSSTGCEASARGAGTCMWVEPAWGEPFCDYWLFGECKNYYDEASCAAGGICSWRVEEWNDNSAGFCEVSCFNSSLDEDGCNALTESRGGICEWRDTSEICMPEFFEMMGGGTGAKTGCMQYDGNETACLANNYICTWFNDSSVTNTVGDGEPDGWCDPKGNYDLVGDMKGEPVMLGMDSGNVFGAAESGVVGFADISGFGMRVTDNAYGFGVSMYNLTDGVVCNGYSLSLGLVGTPTTGDGQNITKMKVYLDTDGSSGAQSHCYATDSTGDSISYPDYEFYIDYVVRNSTTSGNIETTKKLYICALNDSSANTWQFVPTNVFITDDKKFTCHSSGSGALFVSIERDTLENFALFNITAPMKVFVVSFDGLGDGDGADEVGPSYYTPGTVDFGFVDCSDPSTKDSKCKSFQKFGMQMYEDCKNIVDDDGDGLADCDDPKCVFTPACASGTAFDWSSGTDDYKAPIVMFSKVDRMSDATIIVFDTDEPANGTLTFYNQSSTCATLNTTLADLGDPAFDFDDYKPFHKIVLDTNTLGYSLVNSTTYYYKVEVCDPFNNCGTSTCLNFTTKSENKPFIFRLNLPAGFTVDIPAMGLTDETFTRTVGGQVYDVGFKTNSTVARNMNITVKYGNLRLKFVGVDIYKPKTLNLENAFIVDVTDNVFGMNSSSKAWNMLLNDLGLGGFGDSIELEFPVAYSASNSLMWHNDDVSDAGNDVDSYTTCTGTTTTVCTVPTSLGFSTYTVNIPSSDDPVTPAATSGGGGGGAGTTTNTSTSDDEEEAESDDEISAPGTGAAVADKKKFNLPSFENLNISDEDKPIIYSAIAGIVFAFVGLFWWWKKQGKKPYRSSPASYSEHRSSYSQRRRLSSTLGSIRDSVSKRRPLSSYSKTGYFNRSLDSYGFRVKKK
jgi:hypothetical protein